MIGVAPVARAASPASTPTPAVNAAAPTASSTPATDATRASASDATLPAPEPRAPSPLPEIAAVFPGFFLHGSGVWLQHRNVTAQRFLVLEGSAIAATVTSFFLLWKTGAARDLVGPSALLGVAGAGTFAVSFLANVYATWAPRDGFGTAASQLPLVDASVGYLYVYDPQFDYRHFATLALSAFLGRWHVLGDTALAAGGDTQRFAVGAGYRVLGQRGPEEILSRPPQAWDPPVNGTDGSYLEPRVGVIEQRFPDDGFSSLVIEGKLEGRLDSKRILPDVGGAFFTANAGYGRQIYHHDLPGPNPSTITGLLLAGMGFGLYLGHPGTEVGGGEVEVYYDHRHDGFAGGLEMNGIGSGVLGHFGLRGDYQLDQRWGVRARAEAGSAFVLGLDLVVRAGQGGL
jgi:hypothetical protein